MISSLEYPILEYAITRYIIFLLLLKLYTYWPVLVKKGQSIEVVNLKSDERRDVVVFLLLKLSGAFLLLIIIPKICVGVFNILIGDSFYDAFNYHAVVSEAIDEETEGKFDHTSYSMFKFGLRMIIVNLILVKPIFGISLFNHYTKDEN
jgi:accessory gene regulator protein AgrB